MWSTARSTQLPVRRAERFRADLADRDQSAARSSCRKSLPANNLKELIAWLKANPDKATQGTAGAGSASHVSGVYFQKHTGTRFQFVPYRGAGPAMQDLVAGQIDLMIDQAANSLPQVRAGNVKAYAVTAKTRLPAAPDIPTVDEAGMPGFYISVWHASGCRRARRRTSSPSSTRAVVEPGRSGGAQAARRSRPGDSAARAADAARRSAPTTRPRSRSGGRSSRPRTSRASNPRRAFCGRPRKRLPKPNPSLNHRCAAGHPGLGLPYESHRLQAFR